MVGRALRCGLCPACSPARAGATQLGQRARGVVLLPLRTFAREGRMTVTLGRRELLVALGGAAMAWPLAARAQQGGKVYRIGFAANDPTIPITAAGAAFVEGLRENGFVEGKNIVIERRFAEGRSDRAVALIAELEQIPVEFTHNRRA